MLESFFIGLAANFCSETIFSALNKSGVDLELHRAYTEALKKWAKSTGIRNTKEYLTSERFEQLLEYLKGTSPATEFDLALHKFIKIFQKEISNVKFQSAYNYTSLELDRYIASNTIEIESNTKETIVILKKQFPEKELPKLIIFSAPSPHIERTVSGESSSSDLIELIKENRQIVLVGEGGLGKTTELEYVAHLLSNEGWYCGLIRLIDYATTLEQLIDVNFKNWQNLDSNCRILILLDGLDEVENTMIHRVENEIKQFCKANKQVHFLISFRDSYFFLQNQPEGDSKDENRVKQLHLDPIPIEQVRTHIVENAKNPEYLISQIEKNKLLEICRNPFYLVNFIQIYQSHNYIPINKSDFFNHLIESRIRNEEEKGGSISELVVENERKLLKNLEQLALTMQLAGKYKISNSDCQLVISEPNIRKAAIRLVLIYRSDLFNHYRFEHNNFQEFLAAKRLTSFAWEQILQIIFLPNRKLKPKWRNALSFLFNLIDPKSELFNQLIDWLIKNDIESLIKTEIVHLEQTVRNQIFFSIYDSYKIKQITFSDNISEKQLSDFCGLGKNHELLNFLVSELSKEVPIQTMSNIVSLFNETNEVEISFRSIISEVLLPFLKVEQFNSYRINSIIIDVLSKWKLYDQELVNNLLINDVILKNGNTRTSFLQYLIDGNIQSVTANLIINCLKNREEEEVLFLDIFSLTEVIKLLVPIQVIDLLDQLSLKKESDEQELAESDFGELAKIIVKQATFHYSEYPEMANAVIEFIKSSLSFHESKSLQPFKLFFKDIGIILQEFIKAFNAEKQNPDNGLLKFLLSGYLADEECLKWVVGQYKDKVINDENIWDFLWSLNWSGNIGMHKLFHEIINQETDGLFIYKPNQYDEARRESEELWFKAILDKELFKGYINKAFEYFRKDQITSEEYWANYDKKEYLLNSDYIICQNCFRKFLVKGKTTSKVITIDWLRKKNNWEKLQLREHDRLVKNKNMPPENILWINNWCSAHKLQINFKEAITQDGTKIYFNNWANYYIKFSLYFESVINDRETLLNMAYCLSEFFTRYENGKTGEDRLNLYNYLKNNLSAQELNSKIVNNLVEGIDVDQILEKHVEIVENENLIEAIAYLPKYILNEEIRIYVRIKILRTYLNLGGDISKIGTLLNELNFEDPHDWDIADEFIKKDYPKVEEKLLEFLEDENVTKTSLAIYLIKASQIQGLELLQKIITENNSSAGIEPFRHGNFSDIIKNSKLKASDVMPYLTSFLEVYLNPDFKKDDFDNSITQIFDLFIFYLTNGNDRLWEGLENSILSLLGKSENTINYQVIYRYLQKLQQDINVYLDSDLEIEDAFRKLQSMQL